MCAVPPEEARVLELGCAHGVNLMPLAARHRGARFVGVDLAANQIEVGQRRAEELGLSNLELRCADVLDLEFEPDSFDYVIAHGLFSWVPDPVRDAVLGLCRRVLAPDGVAYISYNAMPAWGVRNGIRHVLEMTTRGVEDSGAKVGRARETLRTLGAGDALRGTAEGALLEQELEGLVDKPDAYLLHEYLAPAHRAFYLDEFTEWAGRHGLQYLDDVAPPGVDEEVLATTRAGFAKLHADRVTVEQMTDVAIYRQFRSTLLVHDRLRLSEAKAALVADSPSLLPPPPRAEISALARLEARDLGFVSTSDHEFVPLDPFFGALVELLDGSRTVDALCDVLTPRVLAGEIPLGTANGSPPTEAELNQGLSKVVARAIEDFANHGLLASPSTT